VAAFFEAFSHLLRQPKAVNVYQLNNRVQQKQIYEERSFRQLLLLYNTLIDVRIIEDFIANAVAKIPVKVVSASGRRLTNTNRLSLLVPKANPNQNWKELVKEISISYGLTGNAFLLDSDDYLYWLSPANMKIDLAKPVEVPEHMNAIRGYTLELSGMEYPLMQPDVFHMKTPQLKAESGIWAWGSSPYSAALPVIEALEANYSSKVGIIKDRGALGILSNESQIPDTESMDGVRDALNDYGITRDKRKYIVTTENLKWQQMSLSVKDLELREQGRDDFSRLCELRGVDPLIFNAEGSTYANQEQGIKETYRRAIIPFTESLYEQMAEFTKYHYGGLSFAPDWSAVPELQDTGTEFSTKVIAELSAGILTAEQAFNMLYDELDLDFEADKEKQDNRQMFLDQVMTNRENSQQEEEEQEENQKKWLITNMS
jgi:HK97 family phage portal protein